MKTFFQDVFSFLKPNTQKKQKFSVDTSSSTYLKTKLLIEKYEKKLKVLTQEKQKKFLIYIIPSKENNSLKENIYLREKIIRQNLMILKSRLTGKTYSYTKIVKGYHTFVEKVLAMVSFLQTPLLFLVTVYAGFFVLANMMDFL